MKNYSEETSSVGRFSLNWHNRILAKGRPGTFTSRVGDEELIKYQG